jgi:hypothetical protein
MPVCMVDAEGRTELHAMSVKEEGGWVRSWKRI